MLNSGDEENTWISDGLRQHSMQWMNFMHYCRKSTLSGLHRAGLPAGRPITASEFTYSGLYGDTQKKPESPDAS